MVNSLIYAIRGRIADAKIFLSQAERIEGLDEEALRQMVCWLEEAREDVSEALILFEKYQRGNLDAGQ